MPDEGEPYVDFGCDDRYDAENEEFHTLSVQFFGPGEGECKFQTTAFPVSCRDSSAMQEYGVLDDCKSQPCPSESPGTSLVHPVESLEEMYEMFLGDTFPVVIE